jgi:hypothetical protein
MHVSLGFGRCGESPSKYSIAIYANTLYQNVT